MLNSLASTAALGRLSVLSVLLVLGACGGGRDESAAPEPAAETAPSGVTGDAAQSAEAPPADAATTDPATTDPASTDDTLAVFVPEDPEAAPETESVVGPTATPDPVPAPAPAPATPAPLPAAPAATGVPGSFLTRSGHFEALQDAAIRADYPRFAGLLQSPDAPGLVRRLQQDFRGEPFYLVTSKTQTSATAHMRAIEMRGTDARVHLYVALGKTDQGWAVTEYDMDSNRNRIVTRL